MNTAKQMKALALVRELERLLLDDAPGNTGAGCLPPEADAYVATQASRPSFLDFNLDTPEQSDLDALAIYQRGLDKAYNDEMRAGNSYGHADQAGNRTEGK